MPEDFAAKAQELALQPYTVDITVDEGTNGDAIFVASNPELPNCLSDGVSIEEAIENLADARKEYILGLLEYNLPIPLPQTRYQGFDSTFSITVATNNSTALQFSMQQSYPQRSTSFITLIELADENSDEKRESLTLTIT